MKDTPLSKSEREFILKAIQDRKRLDGRGIYDYREISVSLGEERGHMEVALGDTRVLCQVSGEVVKPAPNRPTEGVLYFNVELSPMASASFEPGRASPLAVQLSRFLEKSLKESRAVDTESLCIVADEKVWSIRVDVHVVDDCGGLATACSVAAVLALSHYRRPDVSVVGEEVTIHSSMDREPVPLNIYHMPICISVAFFHNGKYLVLDPTWQEEKVMHGSLTLAMNVHREVCLLSTSGTVYLTSEQTLRCTQVAATKVSEITELMKRVLAGEKVGKNGMEEELMDVSGSGGVATDSVLASSREQEEVKVPPKSAKQGSAAQAKKAAAKPMPVNVLGQGTAEIGLGGSSAWDEAGTAADRKARNNSGSKIKKAKQKKSENTGHESDSDEVVELMDVEGGGGR